MYHYRPPTRFWYRDRILLYSLVGGLSIIIVIGTIVYAFILQNRDAQQYCQYNKNVIDDQPLSEGSCILWYKKNYSLF